MPGVSRQPALNPSPRQSAADLAIFVRLARGLTARRITAHALLLAVCLWSLYALDLATPGLRDRAGHIKGADFLHFYTAGHLVQAGRLQALYHPAALAKAQLALVPQSTGTYFVASYGPQVYLPFAVLARLPYLWAALAWALLSCALYFLCCYSLWRVCPSLRSYALLIVVLAAAFPGFFSLITYGQTSAPALLLFTLAFLALRSRRPFLAGLAIGSLIYKPQLGLAAAVLFLLAAEWKLIAGALAAVAAQLSFAWAWFGTQVMAEYFHSLSRTTRALPFIEPELHQILSLRGFWLLLIPWRDIALLLYALSAVAILAWAVICWRSSAPLALRYAALLITTALVAPHFMVYDLVILAPALLLLGAWAIEHFDAPRVPTLRVLLYLCYALPLLAYLAQFTRLQLAVVALVALQWLLWRESRQRQPLPHAVSRTAAT